MKHNGRIGPTSTIDVLGKGGAPEGGLVGVRMGEWCFFVEAFEDVYHLWPEARKVKECYSLERIYQELQRYPFDVVLAGHMRGVVKRNRKAVSMKWELCMLLMMERKIASAVAAAELLHSIIHMWLLCGEPT